MIIGIPKEIHSKEKRVAASPETVKKMDIVITTALIPGKPAPVLINEDMALATRLGNRRFGS